MKKRYWEPRYPYDEATHPLHRTEQERLDDEIRGRRLAKQRPVIPQTIESQEELLKQIAEQERLVQEQRKSENPPKRLK